MALTKEEIRKIAELARLELTPTEEKRYAETISAVLDYMKILNEVDTTGVEPTAQVTGLENVAREDIARESEHQKELLAQLPQVKMGELVVPGVFNKE
ncbi:MAG TPA: Asp-tRNA(Asn)/Glu-tRNA(Gln) amidotransferase subunit GatC [Patescibacteria group bacterium]|nr:Asp-tRNA(Asn)/Glu-tRNA(Gln) amidotransferase subunit GatC [Patescibacteria group bacterium]